MSMYHLLDNDKKKNQFSREERLHLLGIMCQYAPLLDNKNASIVGRKEIWETIEKKFNEAGFIGKTSAQLKKYWQNYKYHNKRMKALRKENGDKRTSPLAKLSTSGPTSEFKTEEWEGRARSKVAEVVDDGDDAIRKSRGEIYVKNGLLFRKLSVSTRPTVSPDGKSEARPRMEVERNGSTVTRQESPAVGDKKSSEIDKDLTSASVGTQWGDRKISANEFGERSRSSGVANDKTRNPMSTGLVVSNAGISDNSVTVSIICPEGISRDILSARRSEEKPDVRPEKLVVRCQAGGNIDRSDLTGGPTNDGNENCEMKEEERCSRLDRFTDYGTKGRSESSVHSKDTSSIGRNKALCFLLPKRWTEKDAVANENVVPSSWTKNGNDSAEVALSRDTYKSETSAAPKHRNAIKVKDMATLSGGSRLLSNAIFQEDETKTSAGGYQDESSNSRKRRHDDVSTRAESARLRSNEQSNGQRGVDTNSENDLRKSSDDRDDSFQSEFQELNHQLILRQLETEEKRLKVKIAEMSVHEVQFRIKALNEDMRRAEELHELRLALTAGRKANLV